MDKNKKKRQTISLETKIKILERLENGAKYTSLGKEFNLGESTIRSIKKNEDSIRKSIISGTEMSSKYSSYTRDILIEKMEKCLSLWIEDLTKKRIPISGYMIQEKALIFYDRIKQNQPSTSEPKEKEFLASNGWLARFLKRNNIHSIQIRGESASADEHASMNYPEKFKKIIEEGQYCPDQIFNADETGLFWKKLPNKTYIAKTEKRASGFKPSKERLTVLLCSNASGDKMLKPLVVNKFLKPRALKGKDLKRLPVHWMANTKAWVTSALFSEWFYKCFVPEVESYIKEKNLEFKILLVIDNAPGHPHLEHPNIKIEFLPPNTTSILQPQDQGIISTFKKYYIKSTYQFILNKIENEELTLTEAWKKFNIFDCIVLVASAVSSIRPKTLNGCWKAVWPGCVRSNTADEISVLSEEILMLARQIESDGFDSLNHNDIEELLVDVPLSDDDIVSLTADNMEDNNCESDCEELVEPLTLKKIDKILKTVKDLQSEILNVDPNMERALKIQHGLNNTFSAYQELQKELKKSTSQKLMTNYFQQVPKEKELTENFDVPCSQSENICSDKNSNLPIDVFVSSSDESDIEPIQKLGTRHISDSDYEI